MKKHSHLTKAAAILCGLAYSAPAIAGEFTQSGNATFYPAPARFGAMSMAHRTLPKGTHVVVENLKNRKSVCVTVRDRGPFARGRIADLSVPAARRLGMIKDGVVAVRIRSVTRCPR
jgi:rare lipoprotein A